MHAEYSELSPFAPWNSADLADPSESAPPGRRDPDSPDGPIKLEKRGVSSHADHPEFWSRQTIWKHSLIAKLKEVGEETISAKLEACHTMRTIMRCTGCGKAEVFWNRCELKICPECTPRLARERRESVEWWTKQIAQPKHVVLTVRNTSMITRSMVKDLKDSFTRLRRMKLCRSWRGGFYSLEVTNESQGWHLHIHALVDAKFIPADQLSVAWDQASRGAGYIVKVKDCRERSYLQEVTKYAVKGSDIASWPSHDILAFIAAFEGVKTFGVFGNLYGKRTEWAEWIKVLQEDRATCECGCCRFQFYDWSEWQWKLIQDELSEEHAARPKEKPLPQQGLFAEFRPGPPR